MTRSWWVSVVAVTVSSLAAPVLAKGVDAKAALAERAAPATGALLRTHALPQLLNYPVSEAIWGALRDGDLSELDAELRSAHGNMRAASRAGYTEAVDGAGSHDFPLASSSPPSSAPRFVSMHGRRGVGGGGRAVSSYADRRTSYETILRRMRADGEAARRVSFVPPSGMPGQRSGAFGSISGSSRLPPPAQAPAPEREYAASIESVTTGVEETASAGVAGKHKMVTYPSIALALERIEGGGEKRQRAPSQREGGRRDNDLPNAERRSFPGQRSGMSKLPAHISKDSEP